MRSFGFIITRHVNSESTNRYWNQCVKLIRAAYPFRQIVIIDDNSNQEFVKADFPYQNITIIQSEYPQRGELLPYIYYLRYRWFPNAVILHDSVFIHKRIPFERFKIPVLPLWHHMYDKEHLPNLLRISSVLQHSNLLTSKLLGNEMNVLGLNHSYNFELCFGAQTYINLAFLQLLENKYRITNLVNVINCRKDRCGLERIMGLLFCLEYPKLLLIKSLFGEIHRHPHAFSYTFDAYINDFKKKRVLGKFVKIWTGR